MSVTLVHNPRFKFKKIQKSTEILSSYPHCKVNVHFNQLAFIQTLEVSFWQITANYDVIHLQTWATLLTFSSTKLEALCTT